MALKPTIYKITILLSDLNRAIYDTLHLTIAKHPSETIERMMVRVLAYCLNVRDQLVFCKGLSDTEEPDLWAHSLDGNLDLWIEVGEPSVERIKKASRIAAEVKVYSFNTKAPTWWQLGQSKLSNLKVSVYRLPWEQVQSLSSFCDRGVEMSITLSENSIYVAGEMGECELFLETLQEPEI